MFKRVWCGLSGAPGAMQDFIGSLFRNEEDVQVFMDDISGGATTWSLFVELLDRVLSKVEESQVVLKPSKTFVGYTTVRCLGFLVSKGGIAVDPARVEALINMPDPTNIKELRSYIGAMLFYFRHVEGWALLMAPLNALTKKGVPWEWTEKHHDVLVDLKHRLTTAPLLASPTTPGQLIMTCD